MVKRKVIISEFADRFFRNPLMFGSVNTTRWMHNVDASKKYRKLKKTNSGNYTGILFTVFKNIL